MKISIVFQTFKRLETAKETLKSLINNFPEEFEKEIILMCENEDENYLEELRSIYPFDGEVVTETKTIGEQANEAYQKTSGDYFCHVENDREILTSLPFTLGFVALRDTPLSYIKFHMSPYKDISYYKKIWKVWECRVGMYYISTENAPHYRWSNQPALREEKFPFGEFPEWLDTPQQFEEVSNHLWKETGKQSGAILYDNFVKEIGESSRRYEDSKFNDFEFENQRESWKTY